MQRSLTSLLLFLLPAAALADGKFFPTAIAAHVTIPDQRALIHFTNGTERLVIETRFSGSGTNFAWVVPLPSHPIIEEASPGLFPTLQYLFRPQITHDAPRYFLGILALLGMGYLVLFVRPTKPLNWLDVIACLLIWSGASSVNLVFAFVVFVLLLIGLLLVRFAKGSALVVFLYLIFTFFLAGQFLPALSTAGSKSMASVPSHQTVSILDRRLMGVFETTTIASHSPKALYAWLHENGFVISANSEPVIESYVKDGWVFVAAKVRRDKGDRETSTPHPLSFTFKTDKPVYPMRLTGVDNGPVQVELYVFGPDRVEARHFKVERCTRPAYPEPPKYWSHRSSETPNILHPLLRKWVVGSPVATKLSATLTPEDMRQDVWLEWVPFAEKKSQVFSRTGAWTHVLNWGSGLFAAGLLLAFVFVRVDDRRKPWLPKLSLGVGAGSIALVCAVYFALPKIDVRLVKYPTVEAQIKLDDLCIWLESHDPTTLAELRNQAKRALANPTNDAEWQRFSPDRHWHYQDWDNFLVGGRIHEEDSPGNYTFREVGDLVQFVGYDAQGAEDVLGEWPLRQGR
ncbi:MAG: DUF2330 domain-containing protein [Limisphaerales bacterium]